MPAPLESLAGDTTAFGFVSGPGNLQIAELWEPAVSDLMQWAWGVG
jgi:hypothetical protein